MIRFLQALSAALLPLCPEEERADLKIRLSRIGEVETTTTSRVELLQAYPNPFNAETNLVFDLPGAGQARVAIHDLLGREVAVLADGVFSAGRHTLRFDAAGLATGVYICRLIATGAAATRTVMVLR